MMKVNFPRKQIIKEKEIQTTVWPYFVLTPMRPNNSIPLNSVFPFTFLYLHQTQPSMNYLKS